MCNYVYVNARNVWMYRCVNADVRGSNHLFVFVFVVAIAVATIVVLFRSGVVELRYIHTHFYLFINRFYN